jgi:hypothetical protein
VAIVEVAVHHDKKRGRNNINASQLQLVSSELAGLSNKKLLDNEHNKEKYDGKKSKYPGPYQKECFKNKKDSYAVIRYIVGRHAAK